MATKELAIFLRLNDEASKQLKTFNTTLGRSAETFESIRNTGAIAFASIAGAIALSVKESMEAEANFTKLNTILNNATGATYEQVDALRQQADALERVGVIDADSIMIAQAKLATFDLQAESIGKLTPALLDYAVAEYGASVSGETLAQVANGFGKALQGQTELLTRAGFVLTEYQKEVLETGTESERLAMMNEILGQTYSDVNEIMADTAQGSLIQLKDSFNGLRESIGDAFLNSVSSIIPKITELVRRVTDWIDANPDLFRTIVMIAGAISGLLVVFGTLGRAIPAIVSGFNNVIGAVKNTSKAIGILFKLIKTNPLGLALTAVVAIIGVAIKKLSDFGKEVGGIRNAWKMTMLNMKANFWEFVADIGEGVKNILSKIPLYDKIFKDLGNGAKQKAQEARAEFEAFSVEAHNTQKVIDETKKSTDKLNEGFSGLGDNLDEPIGAMSDLKEEVGNLNGAFQDFSQTADDSLFEIGQSFEKSMAGFDDKIQNIRASMSSLQQSFAEGENKDKMSLAEQFVKEQESIASLEEQLAQTTKASKIAELQAEINAKKQILLDNNTLVQSLEAEMAEVRRVAGLSEIERAVEEFNQKRALATQEYNEKMSNLRSEMEQVRKSRKEERELYQAKVAFITETTANLTKQHEENTAKNLKTTKEAIDKEIEYYRMLAQAISSARGSSNIAEFNRSVGRVTSVNDAIISPNGNIVTTHPDDWLIATKNPQSLGGGGGIVINMNGGTYLDENVAEEIGDQIMQRLSMTLNYS